MSTADEVQVNAAIQDLPTGGSYANGGLVTLSIGDFITAAPIVFDDDGIALVGQGRHGSCIRPGANFVHTRTGTVDSISGYTMTDADGAFATTDVGKMIINTTGTDTYAMIVGYTSAAVITLDRQIFAATNTWIIQEHGMIETSGTPYWGKIADLYIDGRHGSYAAGSGIYGDLRRFLMCDLLIGECAGHGIYQVTSGGSKLRNSYIYQNEGSGVYYANGASDCWITDVGVNGNRCSGITVETSGIQINHIHTAANFQHGIDLGPVDELYRTVVHNVYFDKNYISSLNITGHAVYGLTVTGSEFWGAGRTYHTAWANDHDYAIGDTCANDGAWYCCTVANGPSTTFYEPGTTAGWQWYWITLTAPPANLVVFPHSGALRSASIGDNHFDSISYTPYNVDFAGAATTHIDVSFVGNDFHQVYPPITSDVNIAAAGTTNQLIVFMGSTPSTLDTYCDDTATGTDALTTRPISSNAFYDHKAATTLDHPDASVTYAKMQHVSATDKVLGRSTAGAGDVEEIACTATGRSILDDTSTGAVLTTIGALPLAGGTMTGDVTLSENVAIVLDPALSADEKYSGIIEVCTAGCTTNFGDLLYKAVADSRYELTDASAEATSKCKLVINVSTVQKVDGDSFNGLVYGKVRSDADYAFTVGAPVFISETAGDMTSTAPTTSAACVRIVGYGNTADELYFCPSNDWMELG